MIPKIIHYCWFGKGPLPPLVEDCISSWKKYLPDYKIIEWNEGNFDFEKYQFASEAYSERKFAFVADVCRLHVLNEIGGIYLDTDIEFVKPLDAALLDTEAFLGFEDNLLISTGIIASAKNSILINDFLKHYSDRSFYLEDGKFNVNPNTEIITAYLKREKGIKINNTFQKIDKYCAIYPSEYFCPKSWKTHKINLTDKTFCIHHFAGSWIKKDYSLLGKLANKILGKRLAEKYSAIYRKLK